MMTHSWLIIRIFAGNAFAAGVDNIAAPGLWKTIVKDGPVVVFGIIGLIAVWEIIVLMKGWFTQPEIKRAAEVGKKEKPPIEPK